MYGLFCNHKNIKIINIQSEKVSHFLHIRNQSYLLLGEKRKKSKPSSLASFKKLENVSEFSRVDVGLEIFSTTSRGLRSILA